MISSTQQELLRRLGELFELAPDVRVGQLLFHLGFLVEDQCDQSIRDIEDDQLLAVVENHRVELESRHEPVA